MSRWPSPRPDPAPPAGPLAHAAPAAPAGPGPHADPGTPARPEETDVTLLHSRRAVGPAPTTPGPDPAAAAPAPADPRDPRTRLESLFDPGSLALLTPEDTSGVLSGTGSIDGLPAVAFASDPRLQGGAMGSAGCAAIVTAYDHAIDTG